MKAASSYSAGARHGMSMRAKHSLFGLGLLLAISGASLPAVAQAAAPAADYPMCTNRRVSAEESEAAHKKYTAGKVDYDEASYESAIARFRDAYAKDCTKHEILVIISRAYEQKGDRAEAVRALEAYLQRVPDSPERSTYESRIARLKDLADKDRQKAAASSPVAPASGPAPAPAPAADKGGGHTVYPWILVGLGGAAIAAGAVALVLAPELPANCDSGTGDCKPVPNQDLSKDREQAGYHAGLTTWGPITMIGGGLLVGGGLLWHFLEPSGSSAASNKTRLTPSVGPGFAGLSLGGAL